MKKILLTVVATIASSYAFAQTNTFPSSGSVGIGTTTPNAKLSFGPNSNLADPTIGTGAGTVIALNDGVNNAYGIGIGAVRNAKYDIWFQTGAANGGGYRWYIGTAERMTMNYQGYVGIGTSVPTNPLTVVGNNNGTSTANTATFSSNYGSSGSIGNQVNITNVHTTWGLLAGFDGPAVPVNTYHGPNAAYLINVQNAPLYFGTNNSQNMMISSAGNVSIGTTDSKGYMFAVNGSAIATSMTVKLNANWPDYVFRKDYQLPSLQEVKAYIEQNQHLPEMPSAKELEREGINLGQMNKLLTKKVEELTLYLIEKDKKESDQEMIIQNLKDRLDKLEQKINK